MNGNDKGCTRSTLSPQTGDRLNLDGLARTCTTLRSLKGPECERKGQSVKCNSQECEYQSQENYEFLCCLMLFVVQWIWMLIVISNGIRGACEAAAVVGLLQLYQFQVVMTYMLRVLRHWLLEMRLVQMITIWTRTGCKVMIPSREIIDLSLDG